VVRQLDDDPKLWAHGFNRDYNSRQKRELVKKEGGGSQKKVRDSQREEERESEKKTQNSSREKRTVSGSSLNRAASEARGEVAKEEKKKNWGVVRR